MPAGFAPAERGSDVHVEVMNLASPHSAITSAHCLVGVGYTDTIQKLIRAKSDREIALLLRRSYHLLNP